MNVRGVTTGVTVDIETMDGRSGRIPIALRITITLRRMVLLTEAARDLLGRMVSRLPNSLLRAPGSATIRTNFLRSWAHGQRTGDRWIFWIE